MFLYKNRHNILYKAIASALGCLFCANSVVLAAPDTLAPQAGNPTVYQEMRNLMVERRLAHEDTVGNVVNEFIQKHDDKSKDLLLPSELNDEFIKCIKACGALKTLNDLKTMLLPAGGKIRVIFVDSKEDLPEFEGKKVWGYADVNVTVFAINRKKGEDPKKWMRAIVGRLFHEIRARSTAAKALFEKEYKRNKPATIEDAPAFLKRLHDKFEEDNLKIQEEIEGCGQIKDRRLREEFASLIFATHPQTMNRDYMMALERPTNADNERRGIVLKAMSTILAGKRKRGEKRYVATAEIAEALKGAVSTETIGQDIILLKRIKWARSYTSDGKESALFTLSEDGRVNAKRKLSWLTKCLTRIERNGSDALEIFKDNIGKTPIDKDGNNLLGRLQELLKHEDINGVLAMAQDVVKFLDYYGPCAKQMEGVALKFFYAIPDKYLFDDASVLPASNTKKKASKEGMDIYLGDIGVFPLLTQLGQITLNVRARYGDAWAKARYIESNMRLVVSTARNLKKASNFTISTLMECIEAGHFGLIRAVEKYEPQRGGKFSTYAYWWIKQKVLQEIKISNTGITVPNNWTARYSDLRAKCLRNGLDLDNEATSSQLIADSIGLAIKDVERIRAYRIMVVSSTAPDSDEIQDEGGEVLGSDHGVADYAELRDRLRTLAVNTESALNSAWKHDIRFERNTRIWKSRFLPDLLGEDSLERKKTLDEVGIEENLTRERVRQIGEEKILPILYREAGKLGIESLVHEMFDDRRRGNEPFPSDELRKTIGAEAIALTRAILKEGGSRRKNDSGTIHPAAMHARLLSYILLSAGIDARPIRLNYRGGPYDKNAGQKHYCVKSHGDLYLDAFPEGNNMIREPVASGIIMGPGERFYELYNSMDAENNSGVKEPTVDLSACDNLLDEIRTVYKDEIAKFLARVGGNNKTDKRPTEAHPGPPRNPAGGSVPASNRFIPPPQNLGLEAEDGRGGISLGRMETPTFRPGSFMFKPDNDGSQNRPGLPAAAVSRASSAGAKETEDLVALLPGMVNDIADFLNTASPDELRTAFERCFSKLILPDSGWNSLVGEIVDRRRQAPFKSNPEDPYSLSKELIDISAGFVQRFCESGSPITEKPVAIRIVSHDALIEDDADLDERHIVGEQTTSACSFSTTPAAAYPVGKRAPEATLHSQKARIEAILDFLTKDNAKELLKIASGDLGRSVELSEINRFVDIVPIKFGQFEYIFQLIIRVRGERMPIIAAMHIPADSFAARLMAMDAANQIRLVKNYGDSIYPAFYATGEGMSKTEGPILIYVNKWLTGHLEAHIKERENGSNFILWKMQNGRETHIKLTGDQSREVALGIYEIVSTFNELDLEFVKVNAGDFVVMMSPDGTVNVRPITARICDDHPAIRYLRDSRKYQIDRDGAMKFLSGLFKLRAIDCEAEYDLEQMIDRGKMGSVKPVRFADFDTVIEGMRRGLRRRFSLDRAPRLYIDRFVDEAMRDALGQFKVYLNSGAAMDEYLTANRAGIISAIERYESGTPAEPGNSGTNLGGVGLMPSGRKVGTPALMDMLIRACMPASKWLFGLMFTDDRPGVGSKIEPHMVAAKLLGAILTGIDENGMKGIVNLSPAKAIRLTHRALALHPISKDGSNLLAELNDCLRLAFAFNMSAQEGGVGAMLRNLALKLREKGIWRICIQTFSFRSIDPDDCTRRLIEAIEKDAGYAGNIELPQILTSKLLDGRPTQQALNKNVNSVRGINQRLRLALSADEPKDTDSDEYYWFTLGKDLRARGITGISIVRRKPGPKAKGAIPESAARAAAGAAAAGHMDGGGMMPDSIIARRAVYLLGIFNNNRPFNSEGFTIDELADFLIGNQLLAPELFPQGTSKHSLRTMLREVVSYIVKTGTMRVEEFAGKKMAHLYYMCKANSEAEGDGKNGTGTIFSKSGNEKIVPVPIFSNNEIDEAWAMVEEAFAGAIVGVNIRLLAQVVNEHYQATVITDDNIKDEKAGFIFSQIATFGDAKDGDKAQGLGIVLPELAKKGIKVAVLLNSDPNERSRQEALIEELNHKIDKPEQRIRCGASVGEIGGEFADLRNERPARFYYLKTASEDPMDGVVGSIDIVVREILRILGRLCGIITEGREPDKLREAAKKFAQAA